MSLSTESAREQMFTRRAFVLGGGMAAAGLALAGRLTWLSVFQSEKYANLSEGNRVQNRLIPPRRGWIIDRAGKPLALNQPDYSLSLIPEQVGDLEATLTALTRLLPMTEEDLERIRKQFASQPKYMPVEVKAGIAWPQFAELNVRLPDLPGIMPVRGFSRVYPEGERFAHLLGYVGTASAEQYKESRDPLLIFPGFKIGKDGIEKKADLALRGKPGANRVEVNARGRVIRELDTRSDIPGANLRLTIDRDLQSYAARRLGDNSASVIVMDCQTGDVLCLLSMPAYDPNIFSTRIPHALWNDLQRSDHHPLINKSVQGLYPPGSTFKMVTTLAILASGIPPEEGCVCNGRYRMGGNTWHCWSRRGHGRVTMLPGLYKSCDVYFYTFGRAIGIDPIARMAHRCGLGQKYDLPIPAQSAGTVPDEAWLERRYDRSWSAADTLNASIGQGYFLTNPLQLAVMASRIASGRAVVPRLLADAPYTPAPSLGIPEEHLALVRQGMIDVVNAGGGTARGARFRVEGVSMAGKTGTAQVRRITAAERRRGVRSNASLPWKFRDHALFVAFAPTDAPRYAVSVIVEHGSSGAKTAAPIARDILTFLFEPERAMNTLEPIERAAAARREAAARAAAEAASMAVAPDSIAPPPPTPATT